MSTIVELMPVSFALSSNTIAIALLAIACGILARHPRLKKRGVWAAALSGIIAICSCAWDWYEPRIVTDDHVKRRTTCWGNLRVLLIAMHQYAGENGGEFPDDIGTLSQYPDWIGERTFICPNRWHDDSLPDSGYVYGGQGCGPNDPNAAVTAVLFCVDHGNHWMIVGFADGHGWRTRHRELGKLEHDHGWIVPSSIGENQLLSTDPRRHVSVMLLGAAILATLVAWRPWNFCNQQPSDAAHDGQI